jgi:hypothetical protein
MKRIISVHMLLVQPVLISCLYSVSGDVLPEWIWAEKYLRCLITLSNVLWHSCLWLHSARRSTVWLSFCLHQKWHVKYLTNQNCLFTWIHDSSTYLLHVAGYYLKSCHTACQKKISCFLMEPEGSLPFSHKPATGPCPEPAESSSSHQSLSP